MTNEEFQFILFDRIENIKQIEETRSKFDNGKEIDW